MSGARPRATNRPHSNTADKALYVAKQTGRNRLEWSDGRIVSRLAR